MVLQVLEREQKKIKQIVKKHDKRYFPRWEVNKRVEYIEAAGIFRAYTKDLSLDGASVFIFGEPPARQRVRLKVHLTEENNFEAQCRVAWSKLEPTHIQLGMIFENLSEKAQELILLYAFETREEDLFLDRLIKSVNSQEKVPPRTLR